MISALLAFIVKLFISVIFLIMLAAFIEFMIVLINGILGDPF